jgi:hypothetical protein
LVSGEAGAAITTPYLLTAETINSILVQEKGEERQEQDPDTDLDMDSFLSDLERNSARTSGTFRSNISATNIIHVPNSFP